MHSQPSPHCLKSYAGYIFAVCFAASNAHAGSIFFDADPGWNGFFIEAEVEAGYRPAGGPSGVGERSRRDSGFLRIAPGTVAPNETLALLSTVTGTPLAATFLPDAGEAKDVATGGLEFTFTVGSPASVDSFNINFSSTTSAEVAQVDFGGGLENADAFFRINIKLRSVFPATMPGAGIRFPDLPPLSDPDTEFFVGVFKFIQLGTPVFGFTAAGDDGITVPLSLTNPGDELTYEFIYEITTPFGTDPTYSYSLTGESGLGIAPQLLVTNAVGGSVVRDPGGTDYPFGTAVRLTAVPDPGFVFNGWQGGLSGNENPAWIVMDDAKQLTAVFAPNLADALDTPGRCYLQSGDAFWFPQNEFTHDEVDAVRSGAIGHNQSSSFSTIVEGPGTIEFRWAVVSQEKSDFLRFSINGVEQDAISGFLGWSKQTYKLPAGCHELVWAYTKDGSGNAGLDAGFVDQITWSSTAGFPGWAAAAGLAGDDALPDATPHGDGVANLLKFAFNLDGTGPDARPLVPETGTAGLPVLRRLPTQPDVIRLEYLRRLGTCLEYVPQQNTTLHPGFWMPAEGLTTVTPINANWERVFLDIPLDPAANPARFFRLRLNLPCGAGS